MSKAPDKQPQPHPPKPPKQKLRAGFLLPLIGFVILATVAAIALFSTLSGSRNVAQLPSVMIGKSPPEIALPLLQNDGALDLSRYQGKPLLVNFFASWCAPCRAEAPALEILSKEVPILGIAYKDKAADTEQFITQFGNPFVAIAMDYDGQAGLRWGVYGVPETYLLGSDGRIIYRHAGPVDRRVIDTILRPAIAKADGASR